MTAEQKQSLARFLDMAGDYLNGGYVRPRPGPGFSDDGPAGPRAGGAASPSPPAFRDMAALSPAAREGAPGPEGARPGGPGDTLEGIAADIQTCRLCPLGAGRTRAVPGEGAERPLVMVIGEAPGQDEDRTGRPFVGRAGQLLDKMLAAIGLDRHTNCFIANVVKCRPPENRDPAPGEIRSCAPFLNRHIACLRPRLILCLGRIAANTLLGNGEPAAIGSLRGRFFDYTPESRRPPAGTPPAGLPAPGLSAPGSPDSPETGGIGAAGAAETGGSPGEPEPRPVPLLATYHPSALLRNEDLKRPAWEDLKLLRSKLEETRGI